MVLEFDLANLDHDRLSSSQGVAEAMTAEVRRVVAQRMAVGTSRVEVELRPGLVHFCVKVATPRGTHEAHELKAQIDGDVESFFRSVEERMRTIPGVQDAATEPGLGCGSLSARVEDLSTTVGSTMLSGGSADAADTLTVRMVPASRGSASSENSAMRTPAPLLDMRKAVHHQEISDNLAAFPRTMTTLLVCELVVDFFANWKLTQNNSKQDIEALMRDMSGFMSQLVGISSPAPVTVELDHERGGVFFKLPMGSAEEAIEVKQRLDDNVDGFLASFERNLKKFVFDSRGMDIDESLEMGCGSVRTALKVGKLKKRV